MEIKGILNNGFTKNPSQAQKVESNKKDSKEQKDRIEISPEARDLAKVEPGSQKLEEIRQKLQNKFYDSDAVVEKVAEKILKEILKP